MGTHEIYERFFSEHTDLLPIRHKIEASVRLLKETALAGNKLLLCGNGGSHADCEHIAGELLKSFLLPRKIKPDLSAALEKAYGKEGAEIAARLQQGVPCIPLTSFPALHSAFANDCDAAYVFAQLVNVLGREGDVLIAISTSGNSKNVLLAAKVARVLGMKVIGFTGEKGGALYDLCDVVLNAPTEQTYRVQEYHECIYHLLCMALERELFV